MTAWKHIGNKEVDRAITSIYRVDTVNKKERKLSQYGLVIRTKTFVTKMLISITDHLGEE